MRKSFALVLILTLTCIFSACSNSADTSTRANLYAEEFAEAREMANDMQLEILADDKITETEMKELATIYTACLREHDISYNMDKYYAVDIASGSGKDAYECQKNSPENVQQLYKMVTTNPTKVEDDELRLQCLIRRKIVPDDLTLEEYKYYREKNSVSQHFEMTDHGTAIITDDYGNRAEVPYEEIQNGDDSYIDIPAYDFGVPKEPVYFPNGVSLNDPRVGSCTIDPSPKAD
ncbi:MAG: hypothetical protein LBL41_05400 [Bifidobacteriaceae bacterium]|jgi:hypothetical protein|nr:hypothetical protein [Bifidobacteriaceae bacterium]